MKETMDSIAARADDCMGRGDWDGAERVFLAALAEAEETGDRRAALSLCRDLWQKKILLKCPVRCSKCFLTPATASSSTTVTS